MFSGNRPQPLHRNTQNSFLNQQSSDKDFLAWTPPQQQSTNINKNINNQTLQPNPYQEEWIKEWRNALTKSAYPLWEEWFKQRNWDCQGHLSVKEPVWFANSLHIGEIDLKHKLSISGSTRINGDLHIHGKIWHHPTDNTNYQPTEDQWDLISPIEAYNWCDVLDKSHIQLRPNNHIGYLTTWDNINKEGIGLEQNISKKEIKFISWKDDPYSFENTEETNVKIIVGQIDSLKLNLNKLSFNEDSINTNKPFSINTPECYINNKCVIQNSLQVKDYLSISENGEINLKGKFIECHSLLRCRQLITYNTFNAPKLIIDDNIKAKSINIEQNGYINKSLLVNDSIKIDGNNGLQTLRIQILSDPERVDNTKWLQIPNQLRSHTIQNLNCELWNGNQYPNTEIDGEILLEQKEQSISHKKLGTNLNANENKIVNVGPPTQPKDVATKEYVDNMRLPWKMFGDIKLWIPLSIARKWGHFLSDVHMWSGKFHHGVEEAWKLLKPNDIVGIYPDQTKTSDNEQWLSLNQGCGLYEILEHGDENINLSEKWKEHEFTWNIYRPFYDWVSTEKSAEEPQGIWVGGPEGIWGAAKLMIILVKRTGVHNENIQIQFNLLMSWPDLLKDQKDLEERVKQLEILIYEKQ